MMRTSASTDAPHTRLNCTYLLLAAMVLAFGAWVSFRYTFGFWGADPDVAGQIVLRDGVAQYGLRFLESWRYTQDNWLFSLTPLTFLIYTVFGTNPKLVFALGWLIFLASVGMTSFLVRRIAGRRAAFFVAAVLLFPNYGAVGITGYLSYPVTHDISMAWALVAQILAFRSIERTSLIYAVAAGFAVFIDAVSDPWAGAAIALPLILVSASLGALNWRNRQGWYAGVLCAVSAGAFWAARTRLFGILDFLPPSSFTLTTADGLMSNAGWMLRILANMFNIVPRANSDCVPCILFDFLALATVLIVAAALTIRALRQAPMAHQLILGVAVLSIAGVSLAFMLNLWNPASYPYIGRFFPNFYFSGGLLVGTAAARNFKHGNVLIRWGMAAYGALFILSGIASYPRMWTGQAPLRVASFVPGLGAFLEQNGLSYGYGPYWGSDALMMNWLTGGKVTIHPVGFYNGPDRISSVRAQTSKLWYLPGDEPAGTPETFLVIVDDAESCPSVDACVATAVRQFGSPSRRLMYGNAIVLVWPHTIVSQIADY